MTVVLGLLLLFVTMRDVFQTVIVPRGYSNNLLVAPLLVRHILWPIFSFLSSKIPGPKWKTQILAKFCAPCSHCFSCNMDEFSYLLFRLDLLFLPRRLCTEKYFVL